MLSRDYSPYFIDDETESQVGLGIGPRVPLKWKVHRTPEPCEEQMPPSQGGWEVLGGIGSGSTSLPCVLLYLAILAQGLVSAWAQQRVVQ